MANNRFSRRGTKGGVFKCNICTRGTRNAGQAMSGICPECDEWTQIENSIADGSYNGRPPEELKRAEESIARLKAKAIAKGGSFD
jgi:predicted ATP-dependent serine protease